MGGLILLVNMGPGTSHPRQPALYILTQCHRRSVRRREEEDLLNAPENIAPCKQRERMIGISRTGLLTPPFGDLVSTVLVGALQRNTWERGGDLGFSYIFYCHTLVHSFEKKSLSGRCNIRWHMVGRLLNLAANLIGPEFCMALVGLQFSHTPCLRSPWSVLPRL